MVTAIVIPIIIIYFFWMTKKEMKQNDQKWQKAGQAIEEAAITGEIKGVRHEKQRFYYNRYLFIQEIKLQTDEKVYTVKKITPMTASFNLENFQVGERIRVFGEFRGDQLLVNRFERIEKTLSTPKR